MFCSYLNGLTLRGWSVRFGPVVGGLGFIFFLVGCGGGKIDAKASAEAGHIGNIGKLISQFQTANSGNNPKNIEELKDWAIKNGKAEEKDFVSTRDNEMYVIEPMGMMKGMPMAAKAPVIVHEAKGKDGKKFVLQGGSTVGSEMDDDGLKYMTGGRDDTKMKGK
jgi:hypothetical protein